MGLLAIRCTLKSSGMDIFTDSKLAGKKILIPEDLQYLYQGSVKLSGVHKILKLLLKYFVQVSKTNLTKNTS